MKKLFFIFIITCFFPHTTWTASLKKQKNQLSKFEQLCHNLEQHHQTAKKYERPEYKNTKLNSYYTWWIFTGNKLETANVFEKLIQKSQIEQIKKLYALCKTKEAALINKETAQKLIAFAKKQPFLDEVSIQVLQEIANKEEKKHSDDDDCDPF